MESNIQIFKNGQFGQIRTIVKDNEPWFVGKDVAEVLGYAKPENAIASYVDDEDKTTITQMVSSVKHIFCTLIFWFSLVLLGFLLFF